MFNKLKEEGIRGVLTFFITLIAAVGIIWSFTEGQAEQWVDNHLITKGYATQKSIEKVQRKVESNAQIARDVDKRTSNIETSQQWIIESLKRIEKKQ